MQQYMGFLDLDFTYIVNHFIYNDVGLVDRGNRKNQIFYYDTVIVDLSNLDN